MSAPLFKFKDTHSTSRRPHHRRRFLLVSMIGLLEFVMPWIALHVCIRKNDCSFSLGMFSGFGKNKIRMSRPRPRPAPMASFTGMWPMLLLLWWGVAVSAAYATSMCIYKFSKSNSNRTKKVRVALRRQGIALRIAITILLIFYPGKLLWL